MNIADQIAADMRALPVAARKELRPKLKRAGEIMAADTRARAHWSTRIPATVKVRTSFRQEREGVTVVVGGPKAPHARAYEGITGKDSFRHPVHANPKKTRREWTWVAEPTRPFLIPSAEAIEGPATAMVEAALLAAGAALGFRE